MKEQIYIVNPLTRATEVVLPTTFSELNLRERQDLQEWLIRRPEVLGESLLLITSEFDRFDKSDKRLDLLFLDKNATLVVAELKLSADGSLADQQAIRYAAFCSTMVMSDLVELHSSFQNFDNSDSENSICEFLGVDELPELESEPRVLLVAGSFNNQELTSTVLWLRKFGVDISCVEVTPYRYPGDTENILLVPRTIIPLAEAREYQVSVERKERKENLKKGNNEFRTFFHQVLNAYRDLDPALPSASKSTGGSWLSISVPGVTRATAHYEWVIRKSSKVVAVALHFESSDREQNLARMHRVLTTSEELPSNVESHEWRSKCGEIFWNLPYEGDFPSEEVAKEAAATMDQFVRRTLDAVKNLN